MNKFRIRQNLRQKRQSIPKRRRLYAAKALLRHAQPLLRRYCRIGLYWPLKEEIDPTLIIQAALKKNKKLYLPVLQGKRLLFASIETALWKKNRFGIPEPKGKKVSPKNLDIVFVPLLGFDRCRNRLGMGGGFYDRTFAFLKHRKSWHSPRLIGLAFDEQKVEKLPTDPWDIQLDAVITPSGHSVMMALSYICHQNTA